MRLYKVVQGHGYPILCLHGHPGNSRCMTIFTAELAKRFTTISPDLRGYGRSQTDAAFAIVEHLDDVRGLLAELEIQRCLVLGWSLGGMLAMEMALRYPEQVTGLILVATAAHPRGNHPPITWQDNLYTAIASLLNRVAPGWQWNIDTFGRRSLYRYLIQQHTQRAYRHLADEAFTAFFQTSKFAGQALNSAIRQGYNRLPDMDKITVPTLVLCGERDRHITAVSSQETAAHLPNALLKTYPQTAHLFPWEVPTQVITDINHWLAQHFPA